MNTMMTAEEFHDLCCKFHKKYVNAKRDISTIEQLGPHLIKPIEDEVESTGATACRAGCSHCCYLRVAAFPHEIISIYHFLNRTLTKEQRRETKNKIARQYKIVQPLSIDEHYTTNIECPLLTDGRCSVYPVRPISCAGYHSMSETQCRDSNEHPEIVGTENGGIPMVLSIKDKQAVQNTVVTQIVMEEGDDGEHYELISALHHLFEDPSLIQRWKNGRKLFKQIR